MLDDFNLKKGCWLVTVEKNSKSARWIDPDFPELDAALEYVRDEMVKAMFEQSKLRPRTIKMSVKERKAWRAFKKTMGKDVPALFEYASLDEIAKAGCDVIKQKAKKAKQARRKRMEIINPISSLEV